MQSTPSPNRPHTVAEAAEALGLSVHTVRSWIAQRRIGHVRLGRAVRVPVAEIHRLLERGGFIWARALMAGANVPQRSLASPKARSAVCHVLCPLSV